MPINRYRFCLLLCWATFCLVGAGVNAQPYPAKPVRIIVAFGAGGITDVLTRIVGRKLGENLGQTVIVDNRPGAGGNIAAELASQALPDGYTLFMASIGVLSVNVHLHSKLPYDPVKDFAPISFVASSPHLLVVPPSLPVVSLKEFVDLAKKRPGELNFSSAGHGSAPHLSLERFKLVTGIKVVHVPYKSGAEGITALLTGAVTATFEATAVVLSHLKAGKLRVLAVAAPDRLAVIPEIPTTKEAGLSGFETGTWQGLVSPAKTPKEIVMRLNSETVRAVRSPDILEKLKGMGIVPAGSTAEEFEAFIRTETARWGEVIKASRARIE